MAGSGWDSASRGRGASIEWLDLGVATLLLVAPPPCLRTLLSVWTKGREKIAVARDKRGKGTGAAAQTGLGWLQPDPTHEATPTRGCGWGGRLRCAADRSRGRRAARATGRRSRGGRGSLAAAAAAAGDRCRRRWRRSGGGVARRRGAMCGPLQRTR